MRMNQAGYELIESFEKLMLYAYDDAAPYPQVPAKKGRPVFGTLTIGYGHTGPEVVAGLAWDKAQCIKQMRADVERVVEEIRPLFSRELNDNQFSALVSLAYNIGTAGFKRSSAFARANVGNLDEVPDAIRMWTKTRIRGKRVVSRGLVNRREAECKLWATPVA
jgi:lysozyme